jgi:hypothetical protein
VDHDPLAPHELLHLDLHPGHEVQEVAGHGEGDAAGLQDLVVAAGRLVQRQSDREARSATADADPHVAGPAVLSQGVREKLPGPGGHGDAIGDGVGHARAPARGGGRWEPGGGGRVRLLAHCPSPEPD